MPFVFAQDHTLYMTTPSISSIPANNEACVFVRTEYELYRCGLSSDMFTQGPSKAKLVSLIIILVIRHLSVAVPDEPSCQGIEN